MSLLRRFGTVALAVGALSCESATGVELEELAGTWTAQSAVFTAVADPAQTFGLVADGGTFALTFVADGSYSSVFTYQQENETIAGTFAVNESTLTLSETGQGSADDYEFTRNGNTLTLTSPDVWDFDDDGNDDQATIVITLIR